MLLLASTVNVSWLPLREICPHEAGSVEILQEPFDVMLMVFAPPDDSKFRFSWETLKVASPDWLKSTLSVLVPERRMK